MIASSKSGPDSEKSKSGIAQGHAYTLLAAIILKALSGQ